MSISRSLSAWSSRSSSLWISAISIRRYVSSQAVEDLLGRGEEPVPQVFVLDVADELEDAPHQGLVLEAEQLSPIRHRILPSSRLPRTLLRGRAQSSSVANRIIPPVHLVQRRGVA